MDNRKIILSFFLVGAITVWFLSRQSLDYLYLTFYYVRRLPAIGFAREGLPVLLGVSTFGILFKHSRVNLFMDEVVTELKKVTWPSRQDVVRSTVVVMGCILFASVVLAIFDLMWGKAFNYLLKG